MGTLSGRIALVTGASSGIGRELARQMAKEDCRLILVARRANLLESLAAELKAEKADVTPIAADLASPGQIKDLAIRVREKFGKLDILVNNAAILRGGGAGDLDLAVFRESMEINFFGLLGLTQRMLPLLRPTGQGLVVNLSSGIGKRSTPGLASYCATKFALEALSESLRVEEARHGLQVMVVRPDMTETPMNSGEHGVQTAAQVARLIVKGIKKRKAVVNCTWRVQALVLLAAPLARAIDAALKLVYARRSKA